MKPSFTELLEGATPGIWYAVRNSHYYELNVEDRDSAQSIAEFCPSKCAYGEATEKANAEYVSRVSPATLKLVWEALQIAERYTWNAPLEGALTAHDKITTAIAHLNGTHHE